MPAALTTKALVAVATVVLAIGAERLLNAYWIGRAWTLSSTRVAVATFCFALATSLFVLIAFDRTRRRRRP